MTTPTAADAAEQTPTLHLARWTVTSGSNVNSRGAVVIASGDHQWEASAEGNGAVVIASGDHQWEASAEGNGAIDALFRAVDAALAGVLTGHPRLLGYDVRALGEAPDAEGRVTVTIEPPPAAGGARASGRYTGESVSTNIIAASIDAYIGAINLLLDEEHWAGAADDAGNSKRARVAPHDARARRAELDEDAGKIDTTEWFNQ